MRYFVFPAALWLIMSSASAPTDQPKEDKKAEKLEAESPFGDIEGYYICRGVDNGNNKYSGICTIERKGGVYFVSWSLIGVNFSGIGIQTIRDNRAYLSVSWATTRDGTVIRGINVYDANQGNPKHKVVFNGRWASMPGNGQTHPEALYFLKEFDKEKE